jgi:hypothetical protein
MKGKLFVPALPTSTFPLADVDIRKERNGKVEVEEWNGKVEGWNGRAEWKWRKASGDIDYKIGVTDYKI